MASTNKFGDEYDVKEQLGKGAFSTVHKVAHKKSNHEWAVKIIDKSALDNEKMQKRLNTEVEILKKVQHPNIIALQEVFDTDKKLYLVMPLVTGGELFDKVVQDGVFCEKDAANIIRQVVDAIAYLHTLNIAHRDLKPENLLTSADGKTVMISDFGLSRILNEESMMSTACGTPYYVAPEVVKATGYGKEVDLWSVGVITYFLLCGFPPFVADSLPDILDMIMAGTFDYPSPYWDEISKEAKEFVSGLLQTDPVKRLSASAALGNKWLQGSAPTKPLNLGDTLKVNNEKRKQLGSLKKF